MWFRNLRKLPVRRQLVVSLVGLLIVLTTTLSVVAYRVSHLVTNLQDQASILEQITKAQMLGSELQRYTRSLRSGDVDVKSQQAVVTKLERLRTEGQISPAIETMSESIQQLVMEVFSQGTDGETRQYQKIIELEDRWQKAVNQLVADARGRVDQTGGLMAEVRSNMLFVLAIAVLLGGAFCFYILRQMRNNVNTFENAADNLAKGIAKLESSLAKQQSGASQQALSVEETKRTLETLLSTAHHIAESSRNVLKNAEVSQMTNQRISQRIKELSKSTERIGEILELIKEVANKSDILSLNAALEGTKAGEAGKGFSLVASQMQRLASQVMGSVNNIKTLTAEIMEATNSSVLATEEAYKMAEATTRSARQISLAVRQQQSGTEQVTKAMDRIATVAKGNVETADTMVGVSRDLNSVNRELTDVVSRF